MYGRKGNFYGKREYFLHVDLWIVRKFRILKLEGSCYHSVNFLGCKENIIGSLIPTFRLEASRMSIQRGISPTSSSINTRARFYVDENFIK
jgi:hypothetical protein